MTGEVGDIAIKNAGISSTCDESDLDDANCFIIAITLHTLKKIIKIVSEIGEGALKRTADLHRLVLDDTLLYKPSSVKIAEAAKKF